MIGLLVVDASVAVKWFLSEEKSEAARLLLTQPKKLVAPDILRIETGSAITRRVRMGDIQLSEGRLRCEELIAMLNRQVVLLFPAAGDFADALILSLQLRHAVADCLYLALAQRLGAAMITADRVFYDKAKPIYAGMELL